MSARISAGKKRPDAQRCLRTTRVGLPNQAISATLWHGRIEHDGRFVAKVRVGSAMKCSLCEDCGWVCENHPARPWEGEHACTCGAAGAPCPRCNVPEKDEAPRLPEGLQDRIRQRGLAPLAVGVGKVCSTIQFRSHAAASLSRSRTPPNISRSSRRPNSISRNGRPRSKPCYWSSTIMARP
jgi:hypothetical protein